MAKITKEQKQAALAKIASQSLKVCKDASGKFMFTYTDGAQEDSAVVTSLWNSGKVEMDTTTPETPGIVMNWIVVVAK